MNEDTVFEIVDHLHNQLTRRGAHEFRGKIEEVNMIFWAMGARNPRGATSRFLMRFGDEADHAPRHWSIEFDNRMIISINGPYDDLSNHDQIMKDLSICKVFNVIRSDV